MAYFKGILSGLAAIIFAELVTGLRSLFRFTQDTPGMATDMFGVGIYLWRAVVSPLFWIFAVLLFALFFMASRSGNQILRVVFFWIPSVTISCVGMIIASFIAYQFVLILIKSH
ncbi:MAG: hypothetical protein LAP86_08925 [Acidobacteriia bacterium]|nr:hypothetical protein [Terriglobia bacterium]